MPKGRTRLNLMNNSLWLRQREIGVKLPLGHADKFAKALYQSIVPCTSWDHGENLRNAIHGGVFNLEFSPDGSLLVAACEKKSILMFDPLCRKLIHAVDNAHRDCVNCVRFLDSRVFATCSDDSTVALWDARNLKSQIRTLHGHSNWVKNIEFSPRDGLLVTSGFDGSIYTWDINSYTETGFLYKRVFHTNGLMRTRLNPDASKMIICTTGGYLILIHNLDLNTMAQDLAGFKPNMYRLMQLSQTTIPVAADFTRLFSAERRTNRVEFVTDFPPGDDAEVVSSLQIHPQGWCALSRNISNDENSEWTCVHDIQDREPGSEPAPIAFDWSRGFMSSLVIGPESRARIVRPMVELRMDSAMAVRAGISELGPGPPPPPGPNVELQVSSADVWEALVAIREARARRDRERGEEERRRQGMVRILVRRNQDESGSPGVTDPARSLERPPRNLSIHQNSPRLTHYIEEPNVGRGFIKELCFSADGRLVCSPFGYGVRLLAFSPHCSDLSACVPSKPPTRLHEIGANVCHGDIVVSTKFSPRHCLLVSGCLGGKIVWHQPVV